jgi:hypothetical protein
VFGALRYPFYSGSLPSVKMQCMAHAFRYSTGTRTRIRSHSLSLACKLAANSNPRGVASCHRAGGRQTGLERAAHLRSCFGSSHTKTIPDSVSVLINSTNTIVADLKMSRRPRRASFSDDASLSILPCPNMMLTILFAVGRKELQHLKIFH